MKVSVVYAKPQRQVWLHLEVTEDATVREAIERSGILAQCPDIDLGVQKVGIFGKVVELDAKLEPGARVEIYRPITCDPKTVKRRAKPETPAAAG